jgi:FAD/FMN-containing dehydrogenase
MALVWLMARTDGLMMSAEWTNWSTSLRFTPEEIEYPDTEAALAALVRRAADDGKTIRPVGSSHSSSPILETNDVLIVLDTFQGLVAHDRTNCTAKVLAGTKLARLGESLQDADLSLPNFGDVATQTIAGVIGTGTHGSGRDLKNLASILTGGRLVTGTGEIVDFGANDRELLWAVQVGLGVIGILTQVQLQLVPAFIVQRREYCTTTDACLAHLDELIAENRGFDFYWYPRSDEVKLRLVNAPDGGTSTLPYAKLVEDRRGWAHETIPKHSNLAARFDEMEYALPAEAGPSCFAEVRRRVRERHRRIVGWRVLYRTVAADDAYLSPAHGRPTVTISLHQNASLPFEEYFADIEPIFRAYGGRPHWGKKHTLRAVELQPLYPKWTRFHEVRQRLDPHGVFLSPYLRDLLGLE